MEYVSLAKIRLGLTIDEFYELTPRMLIEALRVWEQDRHRELVMLAMLRADVINAGFYRPERAVTAQDLLPKVDEEAPVRRRRLTRKYREKVAEDIRSFFRVEMRAAQ